MPHAPINRIADRRGENPGPGGSRPSTSGDLADRGLLGGDPYRDLFVTHARILALEQNITKAKCGRIDTE
jgi:hypothetical protein